MNRQRRPMQQQIPRTDWQQFLEQIEPELRRWRRDLHQYPETGWTEYRTTWRLGTELEKLGFDLTAGRAALVSTARMGVPDDHTLNDAERRARDHGVPTAWLERMKGGHTGLVARWDTHRPGPHLAFRFDIDALPITESTDAAHAPVRASFRSRHEAMMHACAHDGHAAIGLGLAAWIARFADRLNGRFTLLFQPAEEGSRGAAAMTEERWLTDVDYFMAGHIGLQPMPVGQVVAATSGFLATTKLDVTFRGRAAHAAMDPHQGRNALLAAAEAAVQLQAIPAHPQGMTRLNVGTLAAGEGRNIIASRAFMQLETRGETTALNRDVVEQAKRTIRSAAATYGVDAVIDEVGEGIGGESDADWPDIVSAACANGVAVDGVIPTARLDVSEDVTCMMQRVQAGGGKATYMLFGTPLAAGHHEPRFDFDEAVLPVAVETLARCIMHLL